MEGKNKKPSNQHPKGFSLFIDAKSFSLANLIEVLYHYKDNNSKKLAYILPETEYRKLQNPRIWLGFGYSTVHSYGNSILPVPIFPS